MSVAEFQHVSECEWSKSRMPNSLDLCNIPLPKRGTSGSAGYDFTCPVDIALKPGESATISTGIRCHMDSGYVLMIFPRSSLGFKYGMRLSNSVGIIDSDYFRSENEGHIIIKVTASEVPLKIAKGDRFCQGIFLQYGLAEEDEPSELRTGGFGSTGK